MFITACWGANFVAAKVAMEALPPFLLLLLRFLAVAALLLPFFPRPCLPLRQLFFLSVLLGTLHFSLMFFAIWLGLSASAATVAGQLGVPFSCLLGGIFFNDRLGRWRSLGMLVAFIGVIVIAGSPHVADEFLGFLVACAAAFAWAGSNIVMKRMGPTPILPLLAWVALLCIPQYTALTLIMDTDHLRLMENAAMRHWLALLYTVIFSTIIAYGSWYWLLARFPVSQVVPYSLLIPIFGLAAAQWFFDEPLTLQFLVGAAFTVAGVAIILLRRPKLGP